MVGLRPAAGLAVCFAASGSAPAAAIKAKSRVAASTREHDYCECLGWWDTYNVFGIQCGWGLEYVTLLKHGVSMEKAGKLLGDQVCTNFLKRFPDDSPMYCVNVDQANTPEWNGQQWCYTSAWCQNKTGNGKNITAGVGWKTCTPGVDDMLRDRTPEQLIEIAEKYDMDVGLLAKMAYPVWQGDKWPAVAPFWPKAGRSGGSISPTAAMTLLSVEVSQTQRLSAELESRMRQVVSNGTAMVFDSANTRPPFAIVFGSKLYEVQQTADWEAQWVAKNMSKTTQLVCVQGCDDF